MQKKMKNVLSLILVAVMLAALFCSCKGGTGSNTSDDVLSEDMAVSDSVDNMIDIVPDDEDAESDDEGNDDESSEESDESTTEDDEEPYEEESSTKKPTTQKTTAEDTTEADDATTSASDTETTVSVTSVSTTQSQMKQPITLYVKDFGAKGDGKTDDAKAIFRAIMELRSAPAGSVLEFEKDKTYYYEDNGTNNVIPYVFYFPGDKDLTVKGNNCLIKVAGYTNTFLRIEESENITVEGFNLDYAVKPAFGAELLSYDAATGEALVKADRDVLLKTGEKYTQNKRPMFGTMHSDSSRFYFWVNEYEMIDADQLLLKVYFDTSKGNSDYLNNIGINLVLPMPYYGFAAGDPTGKSDLSFWLLNDTDITFRNINVYSNKYQTFYLKGCEGTILWDNVDFVHAPYDQDLAFISWGDIYHPAANRAKLVWKDCTVDNPYDDVFNIVNPTMVVSKKYSSTEFLLTSTLTFTGVPKTKVGDTLTIVNIETGEIIGTPTVKKVISNTDNELRVVLNRAYPELNASTPVSIWNENTTCDPASEIVNCDFSGSFRLRANITVSNCRINALGVWMSLGYMPEGPLPHDVLYKNCTFTGGTGKIWEIRSMQSENEDGYHIKNIVFENCTGISMNQIQKDKYDEVIIR